MKNLKSQGYYVVSFYAGADSVPLLVDEKPCNSRSILSGFDKRSEILCTFSEMPKIKDRTSRPVFVYALPEHITANKLVMVLSPGR